MYNDPVQVTARAGRACRNNGVKKQRGQAYTFDKIIRSIHMKAIKMRGGIPKNLMEL